MYTVVCSEIWPLQLIWVAVGSQHAAHREQFLAFIILLKESLTCKGNQSTDLIILAIALPPEPQLPIEHSAGIKQANFTMQLTPSSGLSHEAAVLGLDSKLISACLIPVTLSFILLIN